MDEKIINFSDPRQKADTLSMVRQLDGMHRLKLVKYRGRRSDSQNAYLWGVVYPFIASGMQEAWGESVTSDEAHEFCKAKFLSKPIVNRNTGEIQGHTFPSSAKLDTKQFADYLDRLIKFAAEDLGVEIPEANPEYATSGGHVAGVH